MLGPPPPIPSRTGRRLSADLIAPRIPKGEFLVSFGPSAFVKCILEIESGKLRLSAAVGSEDSLIRKFSSVSLVDLSCAVLRLEDVVRPFHIVIVPKPGAILIPNLKIEVLSGKDEERAQVFAGLKYAAEHNASSNWTFESSLDFTPPKVDAPAAIYQLKKKWWKKNSSSIKANDDNRVLFKCDINRQKLTAGQLFHGVRILKNDASEEEMCRSKEDLFSAQKAFQIIQRADPHFLPHFKQIELMKLTERKIALISRPFLSGSTHSAEVRFARSMGVFPMVADLRAEEGEDSTYGLVFQGKTICTVKVIRKGRYQTEIHKDCPFPHCLVLLMVMLIDTMRNQDASKLSVHSGMQNTVPGKNAGLGEPVDFAAVDVPDGFFGFMSPAFSYATYAGLCPDSELFHNATMIGQVLQGAIANNETPTYKAFLRSIVSHMMADVVGFNPLGGYLASDVPSVNWVTMWTKMQTIDVYFSIQNDANFSIPHHKPENMQKLARDMKKYANVTYSADVLLKCGNGWIDIQNDLLGLYQVMTNEDQLTRTLAYLDTRGPKTSPVQTIDSLQKSANCCQLGIYAMVSCLEMKIPKTAAQCYSDATGLITTLFKQGNCM